MSHDEELRQAKLLISTLRQQLAEEHASAEIARKRSAADRQLAERLAHQLDGIRRSRSWKITRPLRAARRSREMRDG